MTMKELKERALQEHYKLKIREEIREDILEDIQAQKRAKRGDK